MSSSTQDSNGYKSTDLYLALAVAIIVIIITFLLSRRSRRPVNIVLLTGLSDSGKTTIFSKIIFNESKKTVTSLKENESTIEELNLKLIDLPGAERLRGRYWESHRSKARHVVYVVDSTTVDTKIRDLSEYLYTLLSDGVIYKNKIKFTIACNKQDLDDRKTKELIKPMLEKEMNAIRKTKKGQLGKTSNEEEEDYLAARQEENLSLDFLNVNFIETSVHNLDQLIKTIF